MCKNLIYTYTYISYISDMGHMKKSVIDCVYYVTHFRRKLIFPSNKFFLLMEGLLPLFFSYGIVCARQL